MFKCMTSKQLYKSLWIANVTDFVMHDESSRAWIKAPAAIHDKININLIS
jgi:hypothetical protein